MNLPLLRCLKLTATILLAALAATFAGCGKSEPAPVTAAVAPDVAVTKAARKALDRQLTVSSELVPFQEIDVYAKESGFVKQLKVDYGSRVQTNQTLATLEIPELQLQVKEDDAAVKNAEAQVPHA